MRIFFILCFILVALIIFFNPSKDEPSQRNSFYRVVALAPSYCETVIALGQTHRLVGVTTDCDKEDVRHVPRIGSFLETNLEAILDLKPDLILAVPHALAQENLRQIEQTGVKVFAHQPDSLHDIKFITSTVAELLDAKKEGDELNQKLSAALNRSKSHWANSDIVPPTILLAVAHAPFVVAGFSTYMSEIAALMGYKNQAVNRAIPWPIWSPEHLLSNPPRMLVILEGKHGLNAYERLFNTLHFDPIKAGTKLIVPHRPLFFSPSPKLIAEIEYFFQLLNERV